MSSFADETAGDAPVRDISLNFAGVGTSEHLITQNVKARQAVSKISREELEDRYLRLHEETLLLKQHTHKQEDKIKRMATKLIRLVKDRKRIEQASSGMVAGRDIELEEMIEELQEKVRQLEKQNEGLKQRLLTAKQQLQVQSRRPTPYGHIQPRVNSGLRRLRDDFPATAQDASTPTRATRSSEADMGARPPHGLLPRYGHSLLDDARAEIRNLENVIENQRAQMEEMERMTESYRDQLRRKEREYEESLLQLREQQASGQRSTIKDNVELIKLQKQLAEKGNAFIVLEQRFLQLQESQRTLKASHDVVLAKVDELTEVLKEERLKNLGLESQLHSKVLEQRRIEELKEQIVDLEKERDLLKENCDKLVNSAFDVSQEQKWKTREQQLKLQIAQLEMALKSDLTDKNEILDKVKAERDTNEKLAQENSQLQLRYLEQKQQLDELQERMKFFTKESDVDAAELSEALMLIKVRKIQKSGNLDFLEKEHSEVKEDLKRSMKDLQASHAETVQELEKTRNLLFMQHKINKDYQAEVEAVNRKLDDLKLESQMKLEKLAHRLDMRAARIKKLEAQLRDIAYGTRAHVFRPDTTEEDTADEFDETVHLERGENLLEIHLGNARFSPEALGSLGDPDPCTFCTFAFYDYEIQSTPVVRGAHPSYNFTSQYLVRVNDLFLQYLHTSTVIVETQLAEGLDYRTVATGHLRLRQVLDSNGKVFGTLHLVGVEGETQAFGTVDYWLRLRVPMEQAIRLYKERIKAMGYLSSSMNEDRQSASMSRSPSLTAGSLNELNVTVRCCSNLKIPDRSRQPSPYVVYKLYDFPDHDTPIVISSNNAYFDDCKAFPLEMNSDLDRYLRTEGLFFYVFDDQDVGEQLYLGMARVPLLSLAHDKCITGTFELADPAGSSSGQIEVTLKWKHTYLPPPGSAVTPEQARLVAKSTLMKPTTKEEDSEEEEEEQRREELKDRAPPQTPHSTISVTPLPKPRQHITFKAPSKKVSFVDITTQDSSVEESAPGGSGNSISIKPESASVPAAPQMEKAVGVTEPVCADEGEDDEEESHFSEGQVIASSSLSISEESEISEEIPKQEMDEQQMDSSDVNELILSDSDDCIIPGHSTQNRKQPSERIRVEVVSLTLRPESTAAADRSIARLFVEYSILDLPSIETPLSLPKPLPGQSIHYNYSNVIHVDVEKNQARRQALRAVLEGRAKHFESIKFLVVSDPPEEEEQEQECEDVGVAYVRIPDILERQRDMVDVSLNIMDITDTTEVVGELKVTVEALDALKSIMDDPDHDHPIPAAPEQA